MEVVMFGWEFPPYHKGGLGVATYHLASALARQGVSLTFVLPKKLDISSNEFQLLFAEGASPVTVKEIDSMLTSYLTAQEYHRQYGALAALQKYGSTLMEEVKRYADVVKEVVQDGNYDVIHAHDWLTIGAGMTAKVTLEKPLIKHIHATEVERSGGQGVNELVYMLEREGMHTSDAVVTVSGRTKNIVHDYYGVDDNKIHVIHNGIDSSHYDESTVPLDESLMALKRQGKKIILYLGRLTIAKAPDIFLNAFHKLQQYEKDTILVYVGSGEMERQLMDQTASLGLSDKVLFAGWIQDEQRINSIYKTADLFVMPSIMEPFGLVPLESALNGTPALISKQSGVSEVMAHALKTDFWDIDEMVNKMVAVFNHRSLNNDLIHNSQAEVRNITWDKAAEKCVQLYEQLLHQRDSKLHYLLK